MRVVYTWHGSIHCPLCPSFFLQIVCAFFLASFEIKGEAQVQSARLFAFTIDAVGNDE